jgi:hypothetical protein
VTGEKQTNKKKQPKKKALKNLNSNQKSFFNS